MTEHGAQYDHIGSKYDEYARTATLKRAESYTFFRMVGTLAGQHVLDLACGFGFYTRLLKQRGAAQMVGVDISPEMIRLAPQQEQAKPLGITYQVGDAVALPQLGRFDLVTAVYLLNYAESKDQMLAMCRSANNNLVTGGRFIVYTVNPAFNLSKPNSTKYGVTMLRQVPDGDRYLCDMEFVTDPPTRPTSTPSGTRLRMSGRSRRPDSARSPGTPRRWPRKTWRTMGKHIGKISMRIVWSSGWSARSELRHHPAGRGHPERSETGGSVRCSRQGWDAR
jgi:SAM-dependent methyltransferase